MRTVLQRSWRLHFLSMKEMLRHSQRNWSVNYATRLLPEKAKQHSEGWDQTLWANSASNIPLRHASNRMPVCLVECHCMIQALSQRFWYPICLHSLRKGPSWLRNLNGKTGWHQNHSRLHFKGNWRLLHVFPYYMAKGSDCIEMCICTYLRLFSFLNDIYSKTAKSLENR